MDTDREDRVRRRAYEIWEREGKPNGHDREHWERAGREMGDEDIGKSTGSAREAEDNAQTDDESAETARGIVAGRIGCPGLGGYGSDEGESSTEHNGPEGRPGLGGYGE